MAGNLTDFNDLHVAQGLDAVREQVLNRSGASQDFTQDDAVRQLPSGQQIIDEKTAHTSPKAAPPGREWMDALARNKEGNIKPSVGNFELILTNDTRWREAFGYCDFSYKLIKHHSPMMDMRVGEWEDSDTARMRVWLGQNWGITPSVIDIEHAIIVVAQRQRFHPVRDYLKSIEWDGLPRISHWLSDALNAEGNGDYLSAAGAKFLIGAVARVMRPGCKMDNVLIMEGLQGRGKSKVVAALFGEWYSDAPLPLGDKDAYQNIQGVWGIELAELDSFNKAESTTAKMFFSQVRDRYRPSYGRTAQDFPRQCVFIGTTNQEEYLKDYTGNRRYWPVRCGTVDVEWVKQTRDQLWAEALSQFNNGAQWWPDEKERPLFEDEQDDRLQLDPWHYRIEDYLRGVTQTHVTAGEVLSLAIKKDAAHVSRADQNRLAPIMKAICWHKKRIVVACEGNTKQRRHVYVPPEGWECNTKNELKDEDFELPND